MRGGEILWDRILRRVWTNLHESPRNLKSVLVCDPTYFYPTFWVLWYNLLAPLKVHYISFYTLQALMHCNHCRKWYYNRTIWLSTLSAGFSFYQYTLCSINWHWPPLANFDLHQLTMTSTSWLWPPSAVIFVELDFNELPYNDVLNVTLLSGCNKRFPQSLHVLVF